MPPAHRPTPKSLPGELVNDPERLYHLREQLAHLCGLPHFRFPGSQPVSFEVKSLDLLVNENFWVCEKSDGVRVLVLIVAAFGAQEVFLVDRKEQYYHVRGLNFPSPQNGINHANTVLDGELVIDVDPVTQVERLRLLCFDCLVCEAKSLIMRPLENRYGYLRECVIKPYERRLKAMPELAAQQPFEVRLKTMELAYGIEAVFRDHLPSLEHGNDGLIFTSAEAPYTMGTDVRILKWKPPSENSIDFRLELRFPPSPSDPSRPDLTLKPAFLLMLNRGKPGEAFFDLLDIDDDVWEEAVASGEQWDNRVVEVVWEPDPARWRMLRFRDDKREGNFETVVDSVIQSIRDGVLEQTLIEHAGLIKAAWRKRAEDRKRLAEPAAAPRAPPPVAAPAPRPPQAPRSGGGLRR